MYTPPSIDLHIGTLYCIKDNHHINLYSYNVHMEGYEVLLFRGHPKINVFMYLGSVTGSKYEAHNLYKKFICGHQIVYMIKSIVYLKELK